MTGGIACGKSEVGRLLSRCGAAVLDTDRVAHRLQRPGTTVFRAIVRRFGTSVLDRRGRLDRRRLGEKVFSDRRARRALERIMHPRVIAYAERWVRARRREGRRAVVLIPLLYEVDWTGPWDAVLCVAASPAHVRARLRARGLSAGEAAARLAAQMPLAEKIRRADYVIRNNASRTQLAVQVRKFWKTIRREER